MKRKVDLDSLKANDKNWFELVGESVKIYGFSKIMNYDKDNNIETFFDGDILMVAGNILEVNISKFIVRVGEFYFDINKIFMLEIKMEEEDEQSA